MNEFYTFIAQFPEHMFNRENPCCRKVTLILGVELHVFRHTGELIVYYPQ